MADYAANEIKSHKSWRGPHFVSGIYPVSANILHGLVVSALPDGRKADEPLADGCSPNGGTDTNGPTAVLKSVSKIKHVDHSHGERKTFPNRVTFIVFHTFSAHQPFVLCGAVERDKRQDDRSLFYIGLVLRICSIIAVLSKFEPPGTAEHDIDDSCVSDDGGDPLSTVEGCKASDEDASPHEDLSEIIRASNDPKDAAVHKAVGIRFLSCIFLKIRRGLKNQAANADDAADENERAHFTDVEKGNRNPDREFCTHGHL